MTDYVYRLVKQIRPDLEHSSGQQRMSGTADVLAFIYTLPLALVGLAWLILVSDWASILQNWQLYLMLGAILYIFNRLRFFFITEIRSGGYANSDGAMDGIAVWAAILILGPTAIWLKVLWNILLYVTSFNKDRTSQATWSRSRMLTADLASDTLMTLVALVIYQAAGGTFPIQGYSIVYIAPAFLAIVVQYLGTILVYSGYMAYVIWALKNILHTPRRPAVYFFMLALTLTALPNPFGILAAGIYVTTGPQEFLFLILGLLLVAVLARRLSMAAEYSRQQTNQIEQLEKLGRAILDAPPDGSNLAEVLNQHVQSMFAAQVLVIWTESRGMLVQNPSTSLFNPERAWKWLQANSEAYSSPPGTSLPWDMELSISGPVILCPIKDVESNQTVGEVFVELQVMNIPWNAHALRRQLPAVQSLAAQVASALHQARVYSASLAMEKTLQELSVARSIQASFLPASVPVIPGWQVTATLEPARQIAGDFYDFIDLPEGKLGVVIADVADKGLGSALYMALSNTLIRSFASHFPNDPARVMVSANQQILRNARANLFVTVFFAVLDPLAGTLVYANAGHSPPIVLGENGVRTLVNTGMPLGIDEENLWTQEQVEITPGEILLLYTDGLMDAQNSAGEFIDRKDILNSVQVNLGKPVLDVQRGILDRVHRFVGDAPQFDDITLVILGRDGK